MREFFSPRRLAAETQGRAQAVGTFFRHAFSSTAAKLRRRSALLWRGYYFHGSYALRWIIGHRAALAAFLIPATIVVIASLPAIQKTVTPFFSSEARLSILRNLLIALGGALVGATAIGFSIVIFAVQINFARMPYGLFRQLSSDLKLLGAFAGTFSLAVGVAALSFILDKSWVGAALVGAISAITLIPILFLYSYGRALTLINPLQQLNFLVVRANRDMRAWLRSARRLAPLLEITKPKDKTGDEQQLSKSTHDLALTAFFQANPQWTALSRQAIRHAISFSRRYAAEGDHEVAAAALNAMLVLNAAYVEAKGKTFFAQHLMVNNPLATDILINETLEHLRQNAKIGIARKDEEQIGQTFRTLAALVQIYIRIDYSNEYAREKQDAQLAASYLSAAVEAALPHDMPDVIMEGVRLMGQSAQFFLSAATPNEIVTLAEKVTSVSFSGVVKENFRPVTLVGMETLARLTFDLIRTKDHDIHFAAGELRKNVSLLAKFFLTVPEGGLLSTHSTYLAPYYSLTNTQSLAHWLTELANALVKADAKDEDAAAVIHNIERWADDLYQTQQQLLLAAIENKSHFTFDIIHWVAHVTKILIAISQASACNDHTREEIVKDASWLISVLSCIPDDKDAVGFVENFQMTETLFEAALDARSRGCEQVFEPARNLLTSWAFKAGRHHLGWAILERSMYGLATLALLGDGIDESLLKAGVTKALGKAAVPDQELRDRAAREIRRRAHTLDRPGHWSSRIENAMGQVDGDKLRHLLIDLANLLSPQTANEPVHIDYF